jgi:gliding motility-associated-like protein
LFQVFGKNINLVRLQIFNRWGEKVFDSPDINTGWNGDYNGSPQEAGVYVYHLLFFSGIETDARQLKGSITLIR